MIQSHSLVSFMLAEVLIYIPVVNNLVSDAYITEFY